MNTTALITFLKAAGKLKQIKRTGWVEAGVPDPESVADHVYRTTLASMVLADTRGLDTSKVVRMALLHDLPEAVTGDLTPRQKPGDHAAAEAQAFRQVISGLGEKQRSRYAELFREYQAGQTPEAALVHAADKLDMVLQAHEYQETGVEANALDQFWDVDLPEEYGALLSALKKLRAS
ncbi:MAG: HD domain-containing protein [Candidatus Bathyarchaeota archaeon]